jgi:hypothetical protein
MARLEVGVGWARPAYAISFSRSTGITNLDCGFFYFPFVFQCIYSYSSSQALYIQNRVLENVEGSFRVWHARRGGQRVESDCHRSSKHKHAYIYISNSAHSKGWSTCSSFGAMKLTEMHVRFTATCMPILQKWRKPCRLPNLWSALGSIMGLLFPLPLVCCVYATRAMVLVL